MGATGSYYNYLNQPEEHANVMTYHLLDEKGARPITKLSSKPQQTLREKRTHRWAELWAEQNGGCARSVLGAAWMIATERQSNAKAVAWLNRIVSRDNCGSVELDIDCPGQDPYPDAGLRDAVHKALFKLKAREHRLIALIYGIGENINEHTHQEIADQFGISGPRIFQIENQAMRDLRSTRICRPLKTLIP